MVQLHGILHHTQVAAGRDVAHAEDLRRETSKIIGTSILNLRLRVRRFLIRHIEQFTSVTTVRVVRKFICTCSHPISAPCHFVRIGSILHSERACVTAEPPS